MPSKGVWSRKSGDGRRKARFVACGNHCSDFLKLGSANSGSVQHKNLLRQAKQALYVGGQDGLALRTQLRHAGMRSWAAAALDVKTAFLLVPLRNTNKKIVLKPLRLLVSNGIIPAEELWEVTGAIYGLQESPASWSACRDEQLERMDYTQSREDSPSAKSEAGLLGFHPRFLSEHRKN